MVTHIVAAVHIRGRNPDADRKPVSLIHFMKAIDRHAAILSAQGIWLVSLMENK